LDRLFQGEYIPNDSEVYLDQRYIDYLAKNGEDMGRIHWRNFERLTPEFFHSKIDSGGVHTARPDPPSSHAGPVIAPCCRNAPCGLPTTDCCVTLAAKTSLPLRYRTISEALAPASGFVRAS
jgi:hypothetical protein